MNVEKKIRSRNLKDLLRKAGFFRWPAAIGGVVFLFFLVLLTGAPAQAAGLTLEQLIEKMQETYDRTTDLKARFVQEVTIKSMQKTDREEGTVYFKNPKRMLWDYEKPKAKKLVINARKAWLYVPEDRAVYVQDSASLFRSRLTVRFLSGIGKLKSDFHIRFSQPATGGDGHYQLTLAPRASDLGVDKLYMTVDKDSFQIIQCRFADMYGNVTQVQFRNIRTNTGMSDQMFTFKPPAGVDVMKMP